jgi:dissimilatory sulfite reductase (desulfoviridin) alpha/beta subunit
MKWKREAEEAISRVPFFVRKRVKKRVEDEATRCGAREATLQHVRTCQQRFLSRMEEEVRGYQVETCFGPSGCPNRAVISEDLPETLETLLYRRDLRSFLKERVKGQLKMHHEIRVSVSDCPNACSRPQIVDIGLIGACSPEITEEPCSECGACLEACKEDAISVQNGQPSIDESKCLFCGQCAKVCPTGTLKEGKKGYRVLVGGKLGRHPRLAEELPGIFPQDEALNIVEKCLDLYQERSSHGERLGEILERSEKDPWKVIRKA